MNRRLTRIDELQRDIPPARDLWPAIAAAIEADKAKAAAPVETRRRAAWWPAAGLAASVALVSLGVLIGRGFTPPAGDRRSSSARRPAAAEVIPAALRDAEYRKQRDRCWWKCRRSCRTCRSSSATRWPPAC